MHYITDATSKYIWMSGTGREQFFDLHNDAQELHNLIGAPEMAEHIGTAHGQLIESLKNRPEGFVVEGKLVVGRPVVSVLPHAKS